MRGNVGTELRIDDAFVHKVNILLLLQILGISDR